MPINTNPRVSSNLIFLLSVGFFLWMGFLLIGSCLLFICSITISTLSVWLLNILFILLFSILLKKQQKISYKHILHYWIGFIFIVGICGLLVSYFYDFSYDGQAYHGVAVYYLSNGWNLFKEYLPYINTNIYINHYTQGSWIVYTCFYQMIQNFEFAKVVNLLCMLSTWGIIFQIFNKFNIKKWLSIICATLIAFHPVGLNMYLGMYIDGQMATAITILIAILILLYLEPKNKVYHLILCSSLIYLINIKFTGLVFGIYLLGCFGLFVIIVKRFVIHIRTLLVGGIAIIIAIGFVGYPSYVKNTIIYHNPFYPLDTKESTKDVLGIEPSTFKNQNRFENFIQAIFAETGYSNYYDQPIKYKIPFAISFKELERYAFSGVMIGGMGIWFSGILLLSILLFIIAFIYDNSNRRRANILFIQFVILSSCFLLPAPWWARYAPQLFLFPLVGILYYHVIFPNRLKAIWILIILLVVNALLIVAPYTYYNTIVTHTQKKQFLQLQKSNHRYFVDFRNNRVQKIHFAKYQIPYQEIASEAMKKLPDTLFRSEVVYYPQ